MSMSTHEQFNSISNSFEQLVSIAFFGKELIFWLNAKDAAKLKQCSKILNQLIKMENILIENEPLIFRRLIFQKKFDLLEKCIPFRINKQQSYPPLVEQELYQGFTKIGNLKAIQNMLLQPTFSIDPVEGLGQAVEFGKFQIAQFWIEKLEQTKEIDQLVLKNVQKFFQKAYRNNDRKISMILLEYLSKWNQKWKLLFDQISVQLQKQQKTTDDEQYIDYLLLFSTVDYLPISKLSTFLEIFEKPITPNTSDIIFNLIPNLPFIIPPKMFKRFETVLEEIKVENKTEIHLYLRKAKARWSVFIDDFETFKECLISFRDLFELICNSSISILFEFIVERTVQRNLRLDFFNYCLKLFRERPQHNHFKYLDISNKPFNSALLNCIEFHRPDLFGELISTPFEQNGDLFNVDILFYFTFISTSGDLQTLKELIERRKIPNNDFSLFSHGIKACLKNQNFEILDYLLAHFPKENRKEIESVELKSMSEHLILTSNIDLMKRMANEFDFESVWISMLTRAFPQEDLFSIQFVLSEMEKKKDQEEFRTNVLKILKQYGERFEDKKFVSFLNESIEKWSK